MLFNGFLQRLIAVVTFRARVAILRAMIVLLLRRGLARPILVVLVAVSGRVQVTKRTHESVTRLTAAQSTALVAVDCSRAAHNQCLLLEPECKRMKDIEHASKSTR